MPLRIPLAGRLANELIPDHARFALKMDVVRSHPGLALDRYLPFDYQPTRPPSREGARAWRSWSFDAQKRGPWLKDYATEANLSYADPAAAWRLWARRHEAMVEDWKSLGAVSFDIRPRWRWIVGLGNESVLETGITLHHTFGVPHIPGTALKGLTQALVANELESSPLEPASRSLPDDDDAGDAPRARARMALFGAGPGAGAGDNDGGRAGEVVFLGAVPLSEPGNSPVLAVDVMTPHFPGYYGDPTHRAPREVEDPVPIPFLVVAGGRYRVTVAPRRARTSPALVRLAADLCLDALQNLGLGGKTAKGYGYFLSS